MQTSEGHDAAGAAMRRFSNALDPSKNFESIMPDLVQMRVRALQHTVTYVESFHKSELGQHVVTLPARFRDAALLEQLSASSSLSRAQLPAAQVCARCVLRLGGTPATHDTYGTCMPSLQARREHCEATAQQSEVGGVEATCQGAAPAQAVLACSRAQLH